MLEKVFGERCGLPVEVRFQYVAAKPSGRRQMLEEKIPGRPWQQPGRSTGEWRRRRTAGLEAPPLDGGKPGAGPGRMAGSAGGKAGASGEAAGRFRRRGGLLQAAGENPASRKSGHQGRSQRAGKRETRRLRRGNGPPGDLRSGRGKKEWGREKGELSVKRSNNPDVLYGRDFEDDFIQIEAD